MTVPAIKVEGLWKEYVIGQASEQHRTFYDLLTYSLRAPLKRLRGLAGQTEGIEKFWALQDVNFDVQPGDVVGVVGRNGAGKSTLLKILSRITAPTKGKIEVRGRLASLLEVGTGFHPELSGRENIYLNATILGMARTEIARKFDDIVEFSGIEKFLDMPVKRYSSGMYVRLAFSVAAYVEADILLIDEVLAVGDAEFQKRCLGMMGEVAREGRSIVFVSHNLNALRNLCTSGILLSHGRFDGSGSIDEVIKKYISKDMTGREMSVEFPDCAPGKSARITRIAVDNQTSPSSGGVTVGTPFEISIAVEVRDGNVEYGVFFSCFDENQNRIFSSGSFFNDRLNGIKLPADTHVFKCIVPGDLLNSARYTLDVALLRNKNEIIHEELAALSFEISEDPDAIKIEGWHWPILGVVRPALKWEQASGG